MSLFSIVSSACHRARAKIVAVRVDHIARQIREKEREFELANAYEPPFRFGVQAALLDEIEVLQRKRAALVGE